MYISTRMPANGAGKIFAQPQEANAPKPKTIDYSSTCKTLVRAVKLTVIIMLAGLLQVSARTNAQTRISLTLRGATLEKVFIEIEKRSGYTVFYNTEVLKAAGGSLVSVALKDATIDDVMQQCLKGLPLEFSVQDKTVFVKKEARRAVVAPAGGPGNPVPSTFSGVVRTEAGAPLMGASVYVLKLKRTVVTNKDGEFALRDVPDGEYEVIISYVGFENYRTKVSVQNHEAWLSADLRQSMSKLDETVVKGYYKTTNRLNTGDVTTVKGEDIGKQPVSDPILALEGRVPGLYIQQASGVPGAYSTIRVRGQNSLANGNFPLYIVDGVPYNGSTLSASYMSGGPLGTGTTYGTGGISPFNELDPADIESIEILKDADATAIYGSRGANGVILINTKKGKAGQSRFDLNVFSGEGKVTRMLHLLNTPQYLEMRHEALQNDGKTTGVTDYDINGVWDTTRYTDWQKVLIGNTANFNSVTGNLSGGDANTQFVIGGAYSKQGTVYPGNFSDQKGSGHVSLTHASINRRLHMQLSVSYTNDNSHLPPVDYTNTAITLAPDAPSLYDANGNLNWQAKNGAATWSNPMALTLRQANAKTNNLVGDLNLAYLIFPGFHAKINLGYNHAEMNQIFLTPASSYAPPNNNNPTVRSNSNGRADNELWIMEPQLEYEKSIGKGELNALVGTTFQQSTLNTGGLYASGFTSDALIPDPLAATTKSPLGYNNVLYRYNAFFGRLSYDWDQKYIINLTARRDGSSRFGPGKQFGNFGAIGIGWIFSKEKFIENNLRFLSFGKIRGSYGTTGNDQITDYQFLSTYTPYSPTYETLAGLYPTNLPNAYFGWELVKKIEGGIELGFLKDRIIFTTSYYRNRTGNQLVGYPLPQISGFSSVQANLPAVVQNAGLEFVVNTINIKTKNFEWTTSINLTVPENKLIAFPNLAGSGYANTYIVGKSIFMQKVYQYARVNDTTGVYQYASKSGPTSKPSYPGDQIASKPLTQQFYGGLENDFEYKGFKLDIFFQFVKQTGHKFFNTEAYSAGAYNMNFPTVVLGRWRKPGDVTNYGKFSTLNSADPSRDLASSTFGVGDASFIRLKNLALSYRLPAAILKKSNLQNLRIYIQCQNLFVITKFFGMDPETGGANLPPLRMLTAGIQVAL